MSDLESSTFFPFTHHVKHLSTLQLQDICNFCSFPWSTLSSDLLRSSTLVSAKKGLLSEVFHDYPIYKTSNPSPYLALFIVMYFSIANIHISYVICFCICLFYHPNINLRARHFSVLFTLIILGHRCLLIE